MSTKKNTNAEQRYIPRIDRAESIAEIARILAEAEVDQGVDSMKAIDNAARWRRWDVWVSRSWSGAETSTTERSRRIVASGRRIVRGVA